MEQGLRVVRSSHIVCIAPVSKASNANWKHLRTPSELAVEG